MANKKPGKWKEEQKPIARHYANPPKTIDRDMLLKMASEDATVAEICSVLGCGHDLIYTKYADILRAGRDQGNCSLKRKMFELAMSGNCQMLIWLSKQRLGYREQPLTEASQINFNVIINEVPK